ncbi:hypothetical protein KY290_000870 [Solanum tuberosum]|uniref:Uncharacterized protein n=1 Tax=Solanum tuberosum TaxID=4113 RepID=A0ABQ7WKI0_SOLTU|nr:hypothetical protein KY289_000930 [Solanum tuberosum]KAH0781272.1 hypothetical protein KY290_000870 [Solanum tuberosum]
MLLPNPTGPSSMRGVGHCDLLVTGSSVAGAVEDGDGGHKKLSSLGPNMHIKPKVGAAGDIIYFIYSLLLKSGLLTLHVLDV